jgi:rhodanese-related sulfurtransferase
MQRRRLLSTLGTLGIAGFAGCLGDGGDSAETDESDDPGETGETATLGEESPDSPTETVEINTTGDYHTSADGTDTGTEDENGYELYRTEGQEVPLAPTDDAYEWYVNDTLVVADARSKVRYDEVHIVDAHWSPAPEGQESDDPLEGLSKDTRILTYCACPHHLSGLRAASLIEDGYTEVYALDNGIQDWVEKGYPVAGTEVP